MRAYFYSGAAAACFFFPRPLIASSLSGRRARDGRMSEESCKMTVVCSPRGPCASAYTHMTFVSVAIGQERTVVR